MVQGRDIVTMED